VTAAKDALQKQIDGLKAKEPENVKKITELEGALKKAQEEVTAAGAAKT